MTAYIVFVRNKTIDPRGLEKYATIARDAPIGKLEIVAAKTNHMEVLEGPPAEAVVILRFPSMDDALAWYKSDAYQRAIIHRQGATDTRAFLVEGSA